MSGKGKENMNGLRTPSHLFSIPPTRIQSIDFKTIEVRPEPPYVQVATIEKLDDNIPIHDSDGVYVIATQQCFSVKVDVSKPVTRRKLIRATREAYRRIYQEARSLGVRNELDNLRELILYSFKTIEEKEKLILIPQVSVS